MQFISFLWQRNLSKRNKQAKKQKKNDTKNEDFCQKLRDLARCACQNSVAMAMPFDPEQ